MGKALYYSLPWSKGLDGKAESGQYKLLLLNAKETIASYDTSRNTHSVWSIHNNQNQIDFPDNFLQPSRFI